MVKRRGTLKGRGVGPSKVAPEHPEEPMEPETILKGDEGAFERFQELVTETGWAVEPGAETGVFDTVKETIKVTKTPEGTLEFLLDGTTRITSPDEFAEAAIVEDEPEGGRRRSRLKKQARRTQRKRRNRKGKQLRKLTTRRR
jgi:hypothetical protein